MRYEVASIIACALTLFVDHVTEYTCTCVRITWQNIHVHVYGSHDRIYMYMCMVLDVLTSNAVGSYTCSKRTSTGWRYGCTSKHGVFGPFKIMPILVGTTEVHCRHNLLQVAKHSTHACVPHSRAQCMGSEENPVYLNVILHQSNAKWSQALLALTSKPKI